MEIIEAIILGVIQGATEFLPISSSGHLLLIPTILGLSKPDINTIAIAHLGTLLAIVVYFRRDLWEILAAVIAGLLIRRPLVTTEARLGWYIAVGSVPAVIAGLLFEAVLEEVLAKPPIAALMLIVTAVILVIGERLLTGTKSMSHMTWTDSLVVGLAQALALIPGISRSGVTITAGLGRGLDRPTAARYSFLMGVPVIAGAGLLAALNLSQMPNLSDQLPELIASFLASAIVGYLCIHFLLSWLRQRSLYIFAVYCATFGITFLLASWL